jgi:hypothetical protein
MPDPGMPDDPEPAKSAPYEVFRIISTTIGFDVNTRELTKAR